MFAVGCDSRRIVRLFPWQIVDPMLHARSASSTALHSAIFDASAIIFFSVVADRSRLRIIIDRDLVAVFGDERVQRFDQMPRRTIDHRFQRRMNVLRRAASPFFAARNQLQLDHALRAKAHRDDAVEVLHR